MIKHQRILNLWNEDSKFVTRKLNIVNDYSKANYDVGNEIAFNTEVLKCILEYSSNYPETAWSMVLF